MNTESLKIVLEFVVNFTFIFSLSLFFFKPSFSINIGGEKGLSIKVGESKNDE